MLNEKSYSRYQRQIILPEFGEAGQQKLLQAKVLVIGAGGLGCPVLQYLAAAGVGTLGLVDDDVVALNNLHRQVLYTVHDIGNAKAESAARVLRGMNPEIEIIPYQKRLTAGNALALLRDYDIVIDGTDNFATRYMINDACVLLGKPLVYGAISQFEGQVAVFDCRVSNGEETINYRDIFPNPPAEDEVMNCAEAGVLGILPGIIGTMMANETIKLITGIGEPLVGRMFTYNAWNNEVYVLKLSAAKGTRSLIPKDEIAFSNTDYVWLCSSATSESEIDGDRFHTLMENEKPTIVDVREPHELPAITEFETIRIPLAQLADHKDLMQADTIVTICQTGKRSLQAARILAGYLGNKKKIVSLKGGIVHWKQQNQRATNAGP